MELRREKTLQEQGWAEEWEPVIQTPASGRREARVSLWRARVPGGWLCRTVEIRSFQVGGMPSLAVALTFVPDPSESGDR